MTDDPPSVWGLTLMVPKEIEEEIQMQNWMGNIFFAVACTSLFVYMYDHLSCKHPSALGGKAKLRSARRQLWPNPCTTGWISTVSPLAALGPCLKIWILQTGYFDKTTDD